MTDDLDPPSKPTAMLPREQQFGYALAALGVLFAVEAAVRGSSLLGAGLGFGAAVLLALAVRHGQRIITCFAALLAGFLLGGFLPLEVLFLGYGGFIMLRVSKEQGKLNAARPRASPRQRREAKDAAKGRERSDTRTPDKARQPAANRRYTPPKPKPGQKSR